MNLMTFLVKKTYEYVICLDMLDFNVLYIGSVQKMEVSSYLP